MTKATRTNEELATQRALKELRSAHEGVLYTGTRKNTVTVDGAEVTTTRYVLELDGPTLHAVAASLAKTAGLKWAPQVADLTPPVSVLSSPKKSTTKTAPKPKAAAASADPKADRAIKAAMKLVK